MRALLLASSLALAAIAACHGADEHGLLATEHPIVGAWTSEARPGRIFFHPSSNLDDSELGFSSLAGIDAGATYQWGAISADRLGIGFVDRQGTKPIVEVDTHFSEKGARVEFALPEGGSIVLERTNYVVTSPDGGL